MDSLVAYQESSSIAAGPALARVYVHLLRTHCLTGQPFSETGLATEAGHQGALLVGGSSLYPSPDCLLRFSQHLYILLVVYTFLFFARCTLARCTCIRSALISQSKRHHETCCFRQTMVPLWFFGGGVMTNQTHFFRACGTSYTSLLSWQLARISTLPL